MLCVYIADNIIIKLYKGFLYKANIVDREGLEPSANALKGHCSTIELPVHNMKISSFSI